MKIRVTEFATSLKQAEAYEYQAFLLAWSGRTDPDGNAYVFHKCKGPQNNSGMCNAEVDRLLDEARTVSDPAVRYGANKVIGYGLGLLAVVVIARVWIQDGGNVVTYLGILSAGLAIALQEPIANLFGFGFILWRRPFEVGETIEVGTVSGEVKEVNWRSAHIEGFGGNMQVIPNSKLNKETILNFSRPRPNRMELIDVGFSYQDPPYKVHKALLELLLQTESNSGWPRRYVYANRKHRDCDFVRLRGIRDGGGSNVHLGWGRGGGRRRVKAGRT